MSTNEPREDETADWPITPPDAPSEDGEATIRSGTTPPSHRPPPGPPPRASFTAPPPPPLWPPGPPASSPPRPGPGWSGPGPVSAPPPGYPHHPGYAPPPDITTPRSRRNWWVIAVPVVLALVASGGVILWMRHDGASRGAATTAAAPPPSSTPSTSRTTTPPPVSVDPARLPQLLLPANTIGSMVDSPALVPEDVEGRIDFLNDSFVTPMTCTSTWGPAKFGTYVNSTFIGVARQLVAEQPTPTRAVVQAVVAFPDATEARKSYDEQFKQWGDCQYETVTSTLKDQEQKATIGVTAENNGVATVQLTQVDGGLPGVTCERALTVAGNVVVDVRSCSPDVGDTAGDIARAIAAKVTGGR